MLKLSIQDAYSVLICLFPRSNIYIFCIEDLKSVIYTQESYFSTANRGGYSNHESDQRNSKTKIC